MEISTFVVHPVARTQNNFKVQHYWISKTLKIFYHTAPPIFLTIQKLLYPTPLSYTLIMFLLGLE